MQQKHYPAHDLASVVRGASINCIVRLKPATGFGKEDVKITGNMIALLDVNNRISEEYEVPEIYDGSVSNENIFKQSMVGYLRGLISGINICIFGFGSTGSGKTYTIEGEENEAGLIGYFSDAMFQEMEQKKTEMNQGKHFVQQQGLSYSVRIRYIEIVDEEVSDLLLHTAARMQSLQIGMDEWEGNTVLNASWMKTPSAEHLVDAFQLAKRTRCNRMDEHGNPLHWRSTAILTIELLQVFQEPGSEPIAQCSRIHFVDLPGCEKLKEDRERLRIREGNTLNKSIISFADLITDLSEGKEDMANYENSFLTSLSKDILGGNCITAGIFCLQQGNPIGSSITLHFMDVSRKVVNFPVVNDSRVLGLLRKFRIEIIQLQNMVAMQSPDNVEGYNQKISNLEKQLIEGNLERMRVANDRSEMAKKMHELKNKYNELVREKADLQNDLIKSEELRLQVSRALIEKEIQNTKIQQNAQEKDYTISTKLINAEQEVLTANMKEEQAQAKINELNDRLQKILKEKKEQEMEFVALKSNFIKLREELEIERARNANLETQIEDFERLRVKARKLEDELNDVKTQAPTQVQQRILKELEHLKEGSGAKPSSAAPEEIRMERNMLKEENARLKQQLQDFQQGGDAALRMEVERLQKKLREYQMDAAAGPISGDVKMMRQKILYLEDFLKQLEKERSELSVRATMAEEQVRNLHEHLNQVTQNYQKKILELKRQLAGVRGTGPQQNYQEEHKVQLPQGMNSKGFMPPSTGRQGGKY